METPVYVPDPDKIFTRNIYNYTPGIEFLKLMDSYTSVLDGNEVVDELRTTFTHDGIGRVENTWVENYLGTTTRFDSYTLTLDNADKSHLSTRQHIGFAFTTLNTSHDFSYDHAARLKSTDWTLNSFAPVRLNELNYNNKDQLIEKNIHQTGGEISNFLQSIDYRYNGQGWLTKINEFKDKGRTAATIPTCGGVNTATEPLAHYSEEDCDKFTMPVADLLRVRFNSDKLRLGCYTPCSVENDNADIAVLSGSTNVSGSYVPTETSRTNFYSSIKETRVSGDLAELYPGIENTLSGKSGAWLLDKGEAGEAAWKLGFVLPEERGDIDKYEVLVTIPQFTPASGKERQVDLQLALHDGNTMLKINGKKTTFPVQNSGTMVLVPDGQLTKAQIGEMQLVIYYNGASSNITISDVVVEYETSGSETPDNSCNETINYYPTGIHATTIVSQNMEQAPMPDLTAVYPGAENAFAGDNLYWTLSKGSVGEAAFDISTNPPADVSAVNSFSVSIDIPVLSDNALNRNVMTLALHDGNTVLRSNGGKGGVPVATPGVLVGSALSK